ncbi:MAG: TonB family protein [Acidobacteria bacterium]|nr:TonB family protein [Acidobacteriota bacterium]
MLNTQDNTTQRQGGLPSNKPRSQRPWLAASIVLHLSILAVLLDARSPELAPIEIPGDRNGHVLQLSYIPGSAATSTQRNSPRRKKPRPLHIPASAAIPAPAAPAALDSATTSTTSKDGTAGTDSLGEGNTTIALVVIHPSPQPDLSRLPAGTRGDVIIDVVIDKTGKVAKSTMTHGLGHGVDETVLAAVQRWTFQPATRNGSPVESEQELLFHYERG